jgi:sigma-B regulation protein RsbQ
MQGSNMDVLARNNVHVSGRGERAMVFAHGFGCDQNMWRLVAPAFGDDFKVVLFDHVGAGASNLSAYDNVKYSTLHGYADDLVEIGHRRHENYQTGFWFQGGIIFFWAERR